MILDKGNTSDNIVKQITNDLTIESIKKNVSRQTEHMTEQQMKRSMSGTDMMREYQQARSYLLPSAMAIAAISVSVTEKARQETYNAFKETHKEVLNKQFDVANVNAKSVIPDFFNEEKRHDITTTVNVEKYYNRASVKGTNEVTFTNLHKQTRSISQMTRVYNMNAGIEQDAFKMGSFKINKTVYHKLAIPNPATFKIEINPPKEKHSVPNTFKVDIDKLVKITNPKLKCSTFEIDKDKITKIANHGLSVPKTPKLISIKYANLMEIPIFNLGSGTATRDLQLKKAFKNDFKEMSLVGFNTKRDNNLLSKDELIVQYAEKSVREINNAEMQSKKLKGRFKRSVVRLLTKEMNQTDTARGYQMIESAKVPMSILKKPVMEISGRVSFKAIQLNHIGYEIIANKVNYRAALVKTHYKMGAKGYTNGYFTTKAKEHGTKKLQDSLVRTSLKLNSVTNKTTNKTVKTVGKTLLDEVNSSITIMSKEPLNVLQVETKALLKDKAKTFLLKNTRTGRLITKTSQKIANSTVGKFVSKSIVAPVKHLTVTVVNAISELVTLISSAVSSIGSVLFIIALIIIGLYSIISVIIWIMSSFVGLSFDGETYERPDVTELVKILEEIHEDEEEEIQKLLDSYTVKDLAYPNGSQENYKELICALSVYTNNALADYSKNEIKDYLEMLYDQTHTVTVDEYTFTTYNEHTNESKEHTGAHVYVNIARGDDLCYEVLNAGYVPGGTDAPLVTSEGNYVNGDWINIVSNTKKALAETGTAYSQTTTVSIVMNGKKMSVRPDCSGFTSACLQLYGSLNTVWNSSQFTYNGELPGFTKYSWNGWDTLQTGDIISYNVKGKGHVEIFAYNSNGTHYVWNCGSTASARATGVTKDNRTNYTTVWRPNNPSTGDVTEDEDDSTILVSNTGNINYGTDGNETGAISALLSTIKSLKNSDTFKLTYKNGSHTLTETGGDASSADFAKYVYAQHGVTVGNTCNSILANGSSVTLENIKKGDILIYTSKENSGKEKDYSALIYTGSDNFVGFVKKGTLDVSSSGIYDFPKSKLKEDNIIGIVRPKGILVDSVYGSSGCFGGWTDDSILLFQNYIAYDELWVEDDGTHYDDEDYIGYLGYHENDFMDSEIIQINVSDTWKTEYADMIGEAAVYLYEEYRILPSIAVAQAVIETNWGNSESATAYYNFYDYEYSEGDSQSHIVLDNFVCENNIWQLVSKDFNSYDNASAGVKAFFSDLKSKNISGLQDERSYTNSTSCMVTNGYYTSAYADKVNTLIENYDFTKYDKQAFEIRDAIKNIDDSISGLNKIAKYNEETMYKNISSAEKLIKDAKTHIDDLKDVIKKYNLGKYDKKIESAEKAIKDVETAIKKAKEWHEKEEKRKKEEEAAKGTETENTQTP